MDNNSKLAAARDAVDKLEGWLYGAKASCDLGDTASEADIAKLQARLDAAKAELASLEQLEA